MILFVVEMVHGILYAGKTKLFNDFAGTFEPFR